MSHGTLDRVYDVGDWLRREIEYAIEHERIIIPILIDCFSFKDAKPFLQTGLLLKLKDHNGLSLYIEYFDAGVDKLCKQFLVLDDTAPELTLLSEEVSKEAEEIIEEAIEAPKPTTKQLKKEESTRRRRYNRYSRFDPRWIDDGS